MPYKGPDESAGPMQMSDTIFSSGIGFAQSFKDRLQQLCRERHDLMNRMMKTERDIATIERILGD